MTETELRGEALEAAKKMAEDGEVVDTSVNARKNDYGKPMVDLVDPDMVEGVAVVSTYGAFKYGIDNWKRDMAIRRLIAAALRHIHAYQKGEIVDIVTDADGNKVELKHLYQAIWNLEKTMWYYNNTKGTDGKGRCLQNDPNAPPLYVPLGKQNK